MPSSTLARLLRATGLATIVALSANSLVLAKMPFFSVEILPAAPTAGEPAVVVVQMWADADHTVPAGWNIGPTMNNLLVIRSSDGKESIRVGLTAVDADRYEGTITLPAGRWRLVAFPDRSGWATPEVPAGYADAITFTVREPGPDLESSSFP